MSGANLQHLLAMILYMADDSGLHLQNFPNPQQKLKE